MKLQRDLLYALSIFIFLCSVQADNTNASAYKNANADSILKWLRTLPGKKNFIWTIWVEVYGISA